MRKSPYGRLRRQGDRGGSLASDKEPEDFKAGQVQRRGILANTPGMHSAPVLFFCNFRFEITSPLSGPAGQLENVPLGNCGWRAWSPSTRGAAGERALRRLQVSLAVSRSLKLPRSETVLSTASPVLKKHIVVRDGSSAKISRRILSPPDHP